jgi:murein DD-endopeptidase MepM/ murein hydrolase activator NlpD
MRIRPTLLVCAATLVALSFPGSATADPSGGVAAPDGGGAGEASGGGAYGGPVPAAKKQARSPAQRRRVARRLKRRRLEQRRRERARQAPQPAPPAPELPAPAPVPSGDHVFPVAGSFSLGGDDAEFGAPRRGHRHMGHDISAARGTPVVAPFGGVVEWVRYQRGGAGHYVVLGGADGFDYVFMHLRRGSIVVSAGQAVAPGAPIGEVGNSGRSFGAHLHFEVWVGGWYEKGGEPVDPLPLLEDWASR